MGNIFEPIGNTIYSILDLGTDYIVKYINWCVDAWTDDAEVESIEVNNITKYEYLPLEGVEGVRHNNILRYNYIEGDKQGIKAYVGVDNEKDNMVIDLSRGHLMVGGASRWGKSNFLNVLITSLMITYTPNEVMFLGCDFKRSDIYYFRRYKHFRGMSVNTKQFKEQIEGIYKEMESRSKILEDANARNIIKYNEKSEKKLSYIVFVIDELVLLCHDKDCKALLHDVMCASASYGIYFVLASQDFTKDTIGKCKMNCIQTVGFKTKDKTDSTTLMGEGANLQDIKVKGQCKIDEGQGIIEGQIFYIDEEEIEAILKRFEKE